jgi:phage protein D
MSATLRKPRAFVAVAGASLSPIECSVDVSLHQSADTFYAKLPLDNAAGLDEVFWAGTAPIPITINATNDITSADPIALLIGQADEPLIDFGQRTVFIKGRDLTGALTDLKTSEKWQNLSNQQIITQLAGRAGLTVTFGGTTDQAGLQFDQDYNEISDLDSCWNVIVACAKRLGCIAFVKGGVLYIQPLDAQPSNFYQIKYQCPTPAQIASGNFVGLTCARNLNLAKDASIEVQSWQHKQGKSVTSKFQSKGKHTGSNPSIYQFRAANLTKEQQDRIAKSHLKETLSHERQIRLTNHPGDVSVNPAIMGVSLSGTGTDFDQDYILSNVVHRFSREGYVMDLSAHSQDASRGEPEQLQ